MRIIIHLSLLLLLSIQGLFAQDFGSKSSEEIEQENQVIYEAFKDSMIIEDSVFVRSQFFVRDSFNYVSGTPMAPVIGANGQWTNSGMGMMPGMGMVGGGGGPILEAELTYHLMPDGTFIFYKYHSDSLALVSTGSYRIRQTGIHFDQDSLKVAGRAASEHKSKWPLYCKEIKCDSIYVKHERQGLSSTGGRKNKGERKTIYYWSGLTDNTNEYKHASEEDTQERIQQALKHGTHEGMVKYKKEKNTKTAKIFMGVLVGLVVILGIGSMIQ